ncbi:MAG: divalent metal cation transporter [Chlorobi bacterium]|nr:divalent metal cation transporter [Chlorobiota bacterium]
MNWHRLKRRLRILGPGLLYAGAAIGVSHLVQSTRAGAGFGFELLGIILLANALKYPFFRFGPAYTAATGENLIRAYRRLGLWAVVLFFAVSLLSMFVLQAGVTLVTAGLLGQLTGGGKVEILAFALLAAVFVLLTAGKYGLLDGLVKYIMLVLVVSLFFATAVALIKIRPQAVHWWFHEFSFRNPAHLAFLIAFIGWMPAPLDVSVWQSLWTEAKIKWQGGRTSLRDALTDFHTGYFVTIITAVAFLILGALVMHEAGRTFPSGSVAFAGELIRLFTETLGRWTFWIIALAAFTTMFSTTITCFDAYSRVMDETTRILLPKPTFPRLRVAWMMILWAGTMVILVFFSRNMKQMVDFATTLSFVLAPVIAWLNYLAVTRPGVPEALRPRKWLKIYALISLALLTGFSLFYLYWRFFMA